VQHTEPGGGAGAGDVLLPLREAAEGGERLKLPLGIAMNDGDGDIEVERSGFYNSGYPTKHIGVVERGIAKRHVTAGQLVTVEDVILNPTRWQRFRAWLGRRFRRDGR